MIPVNAFKKPVHLIVTNMETGVSWDAYMLQADANALITRISENSALGHIRFSVY